MLVTAVSRLGRWQVGQRQAIRSTIVDGADLAQLSRRSTAVRRLVGS
jgi:hypothetical protein